MTISTNSVCVYKIIPNVVALVLFLLVFDLGDYGLPMDQCAIAFFFFFFLFFFLSADLIPKLFCQTNGFVLCSGCFLNCM